MTGASLSRNCLKESVTGCKGSLIDCDVQFEKQEFASTSLEKESLSMVMLLLMMLLLPLHKKDKEDWRERLAPQSERTVQIFLDSGMRMGVRAQVAVYRPPSLLEMLFCCQSERRRHYLVHSIDSFDEPFADT